MSARTRSSRACAAPDRRRATRAQVSYRELSSEASADEYYIESPHAKPLRRTSSRVVGKELNPTGHKRKRGATPHVPPNLCMKKTKTSTNAIKTDNAQPARSNKDAGVIPPWSTLPYEILLQIFIYASYPTHDELFVSTPAVKWLVGVSLLCKSFAEPALTALYRCPPLDDPYGLSELLSKIPATRSMNYNSKVQRLEVEVSKTLAYTFPNRGHFDLGSLIRQTPQLRDLALYHALDHPKAGRTWTIARQGKWTYQDSIFHALEENNVRLRSWRWNTRMIGAKQTLPFLRDLHRTAPFQALQALAFVNYHPAKRRSKASSDSTDEEHLAAALAVLPQIKQLSFESCSIVGQDLLPHLPSCLSSLTIRNCSKLTSELVHFFLVTHGSLLKELVLDHNQSLSLSFLSDLGTACPHLEVLKMDLLYYNSHATYRDSEPRYEDLLLPDEVPTWPSTLQTLDLVQLRNWDASTAEMFFQSLIDSAAGLPHLRRLVLKAILKIGWRDRASFRDKWIGRLRRVFLRQEEFSNTYPEAATQSLASKASSSGEAKAASSRVLQSSERDGSKLDKQMGTGRVLRRQSSRTSTFSHVEITSRNQDEGSESDVPLVPKRRSTRIKKQDEDEYLLPVSPEGPPARRRRQPPGNRSSGVSSVVLDDTSSHRSVMGGNADWKSRPEKFVQGMCEVVEVRIDNLRPMEEQLNENDFLDEEASGDEDWDGDDTLFGDSAYAW
ncbi:hypothetical protein MMC16_002992 [Acarospora aff. strigata]|nr:hypothetical protein [Acarospora aff. strigata]